MKKIKADLKSILQEKKRVFNLFFSLFMQFNLFKSIFRVQRLINYPAKKSTSKKRRRKNKRSYVIKLLRVLHCDKWPTERSVAGGITSKI